MVIKKSTKEGTTAKAREPAKKIKAKKPIGEANKAVAEVIRALAARADKSEGKIKTRESLGEDNKAVVEVIKTVAAKVGKSVGKAKAKKSIGEANETVVRVIKAKATKAGKSARKTTAKGLIGEAKKYATAAIAAKDGKLKESIGEPHKADKTVKPTIMIRSKATKKITEPKKAKVKVTETIAAILGESSRKSKAKESVSKARKTENIATSEDKPAKKIKKKNPLDEANKAVAEVIKAIAAKVGESAGKIQLKRTSIGPNKTENIVAKAFKPKIRIRSKPELLTNASKKAKVKVRETIAAKVSKPVRKSKVYKSLNESSKGGVVVKELIAAKPAKAGKAKKGKKSEEPDTTEVSVVEKTGDVTDKVQPAEIDEPVKKKGKARKSLKETKGGKTTKEKPAKAEKPKKPEKPSQAGKAAKAIKKEKHETPAEVPPPAEPVVISEAKLLEEGTSPTRKEKDDEPSIVPITEISENIELPVSEESSIDEQKEADRLSILIDDFEGMEEEEEEDIFKRDSIDEKYPLESGESEDEDIFITTTYYDEERKAAVVTKDFFETFGRIPDVDEISVDTSIQRFLNKMEGPAYEESEETLLGEEEDEGEGQEEATLQAYPAESKIPIEDIFSSEISLEYEFVDEEEEKEVTAVAAEKKISDENLFEALINLEKKQIVVEEIDFELLERLAELREIRDHTKAFLNSLIDRVVDIAEYVDPKEVLRENLDKMKLFKNLYSKLIEMSAEIKINMFVNRKVVDYFKRQKVFRDITPEAEDVYNEEKSKFLVVLDQLNSLMGRETASSEITVQKIKKVEVEEAQVRKELDEELGKLHSLMRKTILKCGSDRLNMSMEKRIQEMCVVRKEVSEVRCKLISLQHVKARLMDKMAALENIGPGLFLVDYEDLMHQRYVLVTKIEERSDDLERYRSRFHAHTNILAHLRERETMLYHTMHAQRDILHDVREDSKRLRNTIYELKKKRVRVKKQIREMSFQCGLIDKPALLIDYDDTFELCLKQRRTNKKLKRDVRLIEKKLDTCVKSLDEKERRLLYI